MDFGFSQQQEKLYEDTLAFAREVLKASAKPDADFPRDAWRACGEFGLLGLPVPQKFGGLGVDALTTARVLEAIGRGTEDMGFAFSLAAHLFACVTPILDHGTDAQKAEVLPRLCSGEWVGANAITEAEAGSDVYALKTRVVKDGDDYVLNGVKSYVSNAPVADLIVAYGTINPAYGHLGVTGFLVPRGTPGMTVGRPFEKMGLSTSQIAQVYFEDCRVPESSRLGHEGGGAQIFTRSMLWERSCLFALYVGSMERLLEQTVAFARQRKQFKQPIGKFQAISHRLADMKLRLESGRLLLYRACWLFDQGKDAMSDISMSKLAISEAAVQSCLDALQIHGGLGYVTEGGVERHLRDAVPSTLFSGTSEIHRNIIAARMGL